ncbi:LGFP repeat-containing protein [Candidatus Electrothrix sp.]|uniref:LGFP repeat-containing protein n=3 Tax=Candidatus Electrothrix sp. TaxID=2170559 RepID=UPI004055DBAD
MQGYLRISLITVLATVAIGTCGGTFLQPLSTTQAFAQSAEEQNAAQKIEQKRKKIELHPENFSGGDVGNAIGTVTAVSSVGGNTVIAYAQEFEEGVIVYSDDFGAVRISTAIWNKWQSLALQQTGDGSNLFNYIGVPINDYTWQDSYQDGRFERGCILIESGPSKHIVYGDIYTRYLDVAKDIGLPVSEEQAGPNQGRYQAFTNGEIYWKADTGAFVVQGATLDRWKVQGGAGGAALGYPLSDTGPLIVEDNDGNPITIGTVTLFEKGAVYESSYGTWEVTDEIFFGYKETGGPSGWLGVPVSGIGTNADGYSYQDFENGVLVDYRPDADLNHWAVLPFGALEFYLTRLQGDGDDCMSTPFGSLCGSQDIYAYLDIYTPDGHVVDERFPNSGCYGSSKDVGWPVTITSAVHSDFIADVSLEVWDDDDSSGNDHLGTLHATYSIDNLWGVTEDENGMRRNGDAGAVFSIRTKDLPYNPENFWKYMFWPFENFSTDELTYDQYAATFTDVETDEDWWLHPFNALWFKLYKGVAANGNCFGMGLESIYAQHGWSPYSEPINRYYPEIRELEPDPIQHAGLINELNIKQGYQLGTNMVLWTLGMVASGATHDPHLNYTGAATAAAIGDHPLISIFDDYLFGSGHSVRPYLFDEFTECSDGGPGCSRIYIADSNYPYPHAKEKNGEVVEKNFIEINHVLNTFEYRNYSGGFFTGGRMFWQPSILFTQSQVTPFGAAFELIKNGWFILVGSEGRANQITDDTGKTFFKPGLSGPPTKWADIRNSTDADRLANLAPVMVSNGSSSTMPMQLYAGQGIGASIETEIVPAANVPDGEIYEAVFESGKISSVIKSPGTEGKPDSLTAHNIGDKGKAVSFGIPSDGVAKNITWTIAGPDKQVWAELSNMKIVPGQNLKIKVTNRGYDLVYENDGPGTTADLSVHSGAGSDIVHVGQIEIDPDQSGTLQYLLPVTTITVTGQNYGENDWLLDSVTITLSVQDFSSKGIEVIQYSKNNMSTWEEGDPGENPLEFIYGDVYEDEGATTLYYRSRDYVGNEEEPKSEDFKIDTRNPVVNIAGDQTIHTRIEPFLVDFTVNDPIPGSGIQTTAANLDGTAVTDGETIDLFWFSLGTHTLTVTGKDYAGRSTTESIVFEVNATLESLAEIIRELRRRSEIDSNGIMKSMLAKVRAALKSSDAGRRKTAENQLKALLNELRAQSGKHISDRGAEMLSSDVNYVINNLP